MSWKSMLKGIFTIGISVYLAKGNKAKARDFVNAIIRGVLAGTTKSVTPSQLSYRISDALRTSGFSDKEKDYAMVYSRKQVTENARRLDLNRYDQAEAPEYRRRE